MNRRDQLFRAVTGAALLTVIVAGPTEAQMAARLDSLMRAVVDSGRVAGMSIGVVVGRDTLLLRGYGKANLELDVPTPDAAVYEIGSVTKQFTAVAILQLRDRGLLDLDDDLIRYLTDYRTNGHRITIRRLLDHTSGIRGYTEMPAFRTIATQQLPRDTLVKLIQAEPFDFAPGEAMIYNNSAYFLLGLIIEKVAGMPYEEYVKQHLFEPAGMRDSQYCSNTMLVKRRAHGYAFASGGLRRADYMHHTWPYAAGSLCSTAGDLIAWNQALHGGRLLSERSYHELITPGTLADRTPLRYAMGLSRGGIAGHDGITHGGGIPGFASDLTYLPEQDATIAVLINTTGGAAPGAITNRIVRALFGERAQQSAAVPYTGSLEALTGSFAGPARGTRMTVRTSVRDGRLYAQPANAPNAQPLEHIGDGVFRAGNTLFRFTLDGGRAVRLSVDQVSGIYVLARTE